MSSTPQTFEDWMQRTAAAFPPLAAAVAPPGARFVEGEWTVADAWVEWCDECATAHAHIRVYMSPKLNPTAATAPATFHDCVRHFDHMWQDE